MTKLTILLLVSLSADREPGPHARVQLEFPGLADTAVFPTAIDPALPRVDRIGREVRGTLGERAIAQIDLCVSPAGRVTKLALVEGSSFADFDAAVLGDVSGWRFSSMPGPPSVQTCERAKITYRPY